MLYNKFMIKNKYHHGNLKEELIDLNESEKHSGEANVIRFVGMKT